MHYIHTKLGEYHANHFSRTVTRNRLSTPSGRRASEEEASIISRHSMGANLAGHDSHGIIAIPGYIDRIKRGHIVPGAPFEIIQETSVTTVVNGNWGFGYVVSERAMQITIDKAQPARRRSHYRLPAEPCRTGGRLPHHGSQCGPYRHDDRRFRTHQQISSTVRR